MQIHPSQAGKPRLWDTDEAADFLNVSGSSLEKHRTLIPHIKIGRAVRYDPAVVQAFAKACEQSAA
jgi:hypothetical protein